jgi:ribosome-binding protein aMBF1 (putative translation factor)
MDEQELRDTLGTNIKRYRTRYCWSQEELAEKLNISTNFLCSIEIGKKQPSVLHHNSKCLRGEPKRILPPKSYYNGQTTN